jgi:hypothetical protein
MSDDRDRQRIMDRREGYARARSRWAANHEHVSPCELLAPCSMCVQAAAFTYPLPPRPVPREEVFGGTRWTYIDKQLSWFGNGMWNYAGMASVSPADAERYARLIREPYDEVPDDGATETQP